MNDLGRYFALVYPLAEDSNARDLLENLSNQWDTMAEVMPRKAEGPRLFSQSAEQLRSYARHCAALAPHVDFAHAYAHEHQGERIDGVAYVTSMTMVNLSPLRWQRSDPKKDYDNRARFYGLHEITVELAFAYIVVDGQLALEARLQNDLDQHYSADEVESQQRIGETNSAEVEQIKSYVNLAADLFHPRKQSVMPKPISAKIYAPRPFHSERRGYDLRSDFLGLIDE